MTANTSMNLDEYLTYAWKKYRDSTPVVERVERILTEMNESIVNDHIALRTFDHPQICKEKMSEPFLNAGYVKVSDYQFIEKKLRAIHLQHPDQSYPKIFISELLVNQCHPALALMVDECEAFFPRHWTFTTLAKCQRPWPALADEYEELLVHSEYGAWLYAMGFVPNHFTISVNHLKNVTSLKQLNGLLELRGIRLNQSGGLIKGSPLDFLEQSSTMAELQPVSFNDGELTIPTCYMEFSRRYTQSNGELFQGFLEKSADKIFESTDSEIRN